MFKKFSPLKSRRPAKPLASFGETPRRGQDPQVVNSDINYTDSGRLGKISGKKAQIRKFFD